MSGALGSFLSVRRRGIGKIIPDVVVEEVHLDELAITDHPVEKGAPISDHAYKRPVELIVKAGFSGSGLVSALLSGGGSSIDEIYEDLRELQDERVPFTVTTGKRAYKGMLMQSLAVTTDERTENVLMVVAKFREVIIVPTKTSSVAEQENQAAPEQTAPEQTGGEVQPQPEATSPSSTTASAETPATTADTGARPTPDWNSPTGWVDSAGTPVERNGSAMRPPVT